MDDHETNLVGVVWNLSFCRQPIGLFERLNCFVEALQPHLGTADVMQEFGFGTSVFRFSPGGITTDQLPATASPTGLISAGFIPAGSQLISYQNQSLHLKTALRRACLGGSHDSTC